MFTSVFKSYVIFSFAGVEQFYNLNYIQIETVSA